VERPIFPEQSNTIQLVNESTINSRVACSRKEKHKLPARISMKPQINGVKRKTESLSHTVVVQKATSGHNM